jgi:CBS domain-containing protein
LKTVTINDTLEDVINTLAEHRIHRLFIVNDDRKPIGVISLKDLLLEILN